MRLRPDQLSPQDIQAEQSVLGSILIDSTALPKVASFLRPEDFYHQKHTDIYQSLLALFEKRKPVDLITIGDELEKASQLEDVGGHAYLTSLMNSVPTAVHIEHYARIVHNQARRRNLIKAAGQIAAAAYEESDAMEAENRAKEILLEGIGNIAEDNALISPEQQGEILRSYVLDKANTDNSGIATDLPHLDIMCGGGLRRGNLIVIAARTSVGKSTLAEVLAENAAKKGNVVLFVSLEMSPEEMVYRYAVRSGLMQRKAIEFGVETDEDQKALETLIANRVRLPFHLLNSPGATTMHIRSALSRLAMRIGKVDLVVVDYLQLLKDAGRQEERLRIGEITSTMKMLAREFNVPLLLLSQLNRNIELRGGEPRLSDMLESGRIEADADVVIMLWETEEPDLLGNVTRMKVAKNRQGATGQIPIVFEKAKFSFYERK